MSEAKLKELILERVKKKLPRLHKEHNLKMEELKQSYRTKSLEIEKWFLKRKRKDRKDSLQVHRKEIFKRKSSN